MSVAIKTILVGYDGFGRQESVPALATALAEEHGARLHVVHVTAELPRHPWRSKQVSAEELHTALVESRRARLEQLVATARKRGVNVRVTIRTGSPHVELIREAMATNADLVIVTDEPRRGRTKRGFGTVTRKLLRECPCPVLAKRDHRKFKHARILAAVDVEPSELEPQPNRLIMDIAATIARRAGSQLIVFHAWALWGEHLLRGRGRVSKQEVQKLFADTERDRRQRLERLVSESSLDGITVHLDLVKGEARELLARLVTKRKIDLVVMGTVCRTGLSGLVIGNTAEKVLNRLTCSVLAVKPDDFVSPVSRVDGG